MVVDESGVTEDVVVDSAVGVPGGVAGVEEASGVEGVSVGAPPWTADCGGSVDGWTGWLVDVDGAGGAGVGSTGLGVSVYDHVRLTRMGKGNSSITRSNGIHK